jgi:hypothetical protein
MSGVNRSRGWCFTINNPEPGDREALEYIFYESEASFLVFQLEQEQTLHFQGFFYWETQKAFATVKALLLRAHLEKAKGTPSQNYQYCTKEGRVDGPWEFGICPSHGKRNDLLAVKEDLDAGATLKQISEDHFSAFVRYHRSFREYKLLNTSMRDWEMVVEVLVGPSGIGKSRQMLEENPGAYWKSKNSGQQQFWDGYLGESTIIVDDYYGWFSYDYLLRLLDRYPFSLDTKHGTVQCSARKILFTSNKHPREWYHYERLGVPAWGTLQSNGMPCNPMERRITRIMTISLPDEVQVSKRVRVNEPGNLFDE